MAAASRRAAASAIALLGALLPLGHCFDCSRGDQLGKWTPEQQAYCCIRDEEGCVLEGKPATCKAQVQRLLGGSVTSRSSCKTAVSLVTDRCPQCYGCANLDAMIEDAEQRGRERVVPDGREYDCNAHIARWEDEWSDAQKEWCCCKWSVVGAFVSCKHVAATFEERSQVCKAYVFPTTTSTRTTTLDPYTCDDEYRQQSWSPSKKEYCCLHQGKACPDIVTTSKPYECMPSKEDEWDSFQRQFCCAFVGRGCLTTTAPVSTEADVARPAAGYFDCDAGFANWKHGWSFAKKEWCCRIHNRGCMPRFDCQDGWTSTWALEQRSYCCEQEHIGCGDSIAPPTTTTAAELQVSFECDEGFGDWENSWSEMKRDFCCKTAGVGCPTTAAPSPGASDATAHFDCAADSQSWEDSWSDAKVSWCCRNERVGCVPGQIITTTHVPDSTWEVVFAGSVRVRREMTAIADILSMKDRGAIVTGHPVSSQDGSKWLKLADGGGFMMMETPDSTPLLKNLVTPDSASDDWAPAAGEEVYAPTDQPDEVYAPTDKPVEGYVSSDFFPMSSFQKKYDERGLTKVREGSLTAPSSLLIVMGVLLSVAAVATGCRSKRGRPGGRTLERTADAEPLCESAATPTAAGADV